MKLCISHVNPAQADRPGCSCDEPALPDASISHTVLQPPNDLTLLALHTEANREGEGAPYSQTLYTSTAAANMHQTAWRSPG